MLYPYNIFLGMLFAGLFATAWLAGAALLVLWAARTRDPRALRRWGLIFFVAGLIGMGMVTVAAAHMSRSWHIMQEARSRTTPLRLLK